MTGPEAARPPLPASTFVFLSTVDWDAPPFGSREQLALGLAGRGHRVLFVEVPRALHSLISDPAGTRRALGRLGRTRPAAPRLLVHTPWPVLPVYYSRIANAVNQRLLLRDIDRALRRARWHPDVLWTYWPNSAPLVGRLGRAAIYHCIDDFAAVSYPFVPHGRIARMEAELCRHVDLVLTRTEELAAAKGRFSARTHVLPGGVDTGLFDPVRAKATAADVLALPPPRAGFVGTLDDRMDVDLVAACARALPEVSFVLVGPVKRHLVSVRSLRRLSNVHLLPARAHGDVPGVVAALDVCLIPYRVTPYTRGVSPIKLYEYLAMGKPVVAADLPYVRREGAHVHVARTAEDYVAAIRTRLSGPPGLEERARWAAVAEAHSWSRQVDEIERALGTLLGPRRGLATASRPLPA
jgi:glycosyltransferase involved in cell wall biosynthesis